MQPDSPKLLEDIRAAGNYIVEKTCGRTFEEYVRDDLLRPAVERHFEIIGVAMHRLGRCDPAVLAGITDHAQIIAFRNVLIHGYDAIDQHRVWDAILHSLPVLLQQVEGLPKDAAPP